MDKKTAHAIARIPDENPEDFAKLVSIGTVFDGDSPQRFGVRFTTDYSEWTDYDRREALESLRQLR